MASPFNLFNDGRDFLLGERQAIRAMALLRTGRFQ
jgi:hypothetical protein